MSIPKVESYLMDRRFLAVLRITLEKVLTTEDLKALERSTESRAMVDDSTAKIAGKIGLYFTEHFNLGANSTSPSRTVASGIALLKKNQQHLSHFGKRGPSVARSKP